MQHAPVVDTWHVVLVHVVPGPRKIPFCAVHCSRVNTWHTGPVGLGTQQAPVAGGQLAVAHWVPSPRYVPCSSAHPAEVAITQNPLERQHAPVAGGAHVVLLQVVPAPRQIPC
jgi:hypothetical protein